MPQWGFTDQANNAPKHPILATGTANGETMYANVTTGSFVSGQKVGVLAVDATEIAVAPTKFARIEITAGGTGYTNGNILTIPAATTNATATVTTNSTGGVTSLTISNNGVGVNVYASYSVANATGGTTGVGTGATFQLYFPEGKHSAHTGWVIRKEGTGGRAGRVSYEVLVAGGPTSDGSDDTILSDS
jgi:hypothetical protein